MNLLARLYIGFVLAIAAAIIATRAEAPRHPSPLFALPSAVADCAVPDDPPACAAAPVAVPSRRPAF